MKEIFGKFSYDNNEYAFAYKDYVITIISAGYEYAGELINKECDEILFGITNENSHIMFFGCEFHRSYFLEIPTHIITQGVIVINCQDKPNERELFDSVSFYSPAINNFYPPQNAAKLHRNNDFSIELKDKEDCTRKIRIDNYELVFGFYYLNKLDPQSNDLLNCTPCITFKFDKTVGINELKECYIKLTNFLAFVNFNRNIPFDKITIAKHSDGHIANSGICYINSKSEGYKNKKGKAILANLFDDDELALLFKQVSNNTDIKKHYYIPKSLENIHGFNHSDLLLCSTCFEAVFKECYPDFKAEKNINFDRVKKDYLTFANNYLESKASTKEQKKYAKKFYEQIYNYDGRLEEIFNAAIKKHNYELSDFEEKLKMQIKVSTTKYGSLYAEIRNHFAHGSFFELGDNEIFIYELLHALLYAMNLEAASISQKKSKEIIEIIFA